MPNDVDRFHCFIFPQSKRRDFSHLGKAAKGFYNGRLRLDAGNKFLITELFSLPNSSNDLMQLVLPFPARSLRAHVRADASDEAVWLERARNGDLCALDALMNAHRSRILNLCFQVLRDETEAEDAAQDAFVRAFGNLSGFKGKASFGTWLYRVALNVCLERRRSHRETEALPLELSAFDKGHDERLALEWALDKLSEPLRVALVLREWHGLSYDEMASALDVPVGTVRSRLSAAREEFRRLWTQMEAE